MYAISRTLVQQGMTLAELVLIVAGDLPTGGDVLGRFSGNKFGLVLTLENGATHCRFHELRQRFAVTQQLLNFVAQLLFNPHRGNGCSFHDSLYCICAT